MSDYRVQRRYFHTVHISFRYIHNKYGEGTYAGTGCSRVSTVVVVNSWYASPIIVENHIQSMRGPIRLKYQNIPITAQCDVEYELLSGKVIRNVTSICRWVRSRRQSPRRYINRGRRIRLRNRWRYIRTAPVPHAAQERKPPTTSSENSQPTH